MFALARGGIDNVRIPKTVAQPGFSWSTFPQATVLYREFFFHMKGIRQKYRGTDILKVKSILIVRLDEIGDTVLTTPLLRGLRETYPEAQITLVVNPNIYELVAFCPYVNEVLTFNWKIPKKANKPARWKYIFQWCKKNLGDKAFDLAILPRWDMDYYYGSYLILFSWAKMRVGYSVKVNPVKRKRSKWWWDLLFTHLLYTKESKHEVEYNLDVLRFLEGKVKDSSLELWLDKKDCQRANKVLAPLAGKFETLISVVPGARWKRKIWEREKYIQLIEWLQREHKTGIVLLGGENDRELCKDIEKGIKEKEGIINLAGKTTLRETAAVISHTSLCIGSDTGPIHIAAAMNVPVVALFGSGNHRRFHPWKVPHRVVRAGLECSPCYEACKFARPFCMEKISLQMVKEAVGELWGKD